MSARRLAALFVLAAVALAASGCSDDGPTYQQELMDACYADGGAYFEYEATSAGAHVWCVGPDGEEIAVNVREGDGA